MQIWKSRPVCSNFAFSIIRILKLFTLKRGIIFNAFYFFCLFINKHFVHFSAELQCYVICLLLLRKTQIYQKKFSQLFSYNVRTYKLSSAVKKHALLNSTSITVPFPVFMFSAILLLKISVKLFLSYQIETSSLVLKLHLSACWFYALFDGINFFVIFFWKKIFFLIDED